eukprot:4037798-Pleurochrysis_carterae.AAC.3
MRARLAAFVLHNPAVDELQQALQLQRFVAVQEAAVSGSAVDVRVAINAVAIAIARARVCGRSLGGARGAVRLVHAHGEAAVGEHPPAGGQRVGLLIGHVAAAVVDVALAVAVVAAIADGGAAGRGGGARRARADGRLDARLEHAVHALHARLRRWVILALVIGTVGVAERLRRCRVLVRVCGVSRVRALLDG